MSITNNDGSNNNNENNKKSKENLRELSYLIEEERLLADLKRKSEETLQKLKVEELTLLRFVRGLADASGGADKPIMLPENGLPSSASNFNSPASAVVSNGLNGTSNNHTSSSTIVQTTPSSIASSLPTTLTSSTTTTTNSAISTIEQNVNNTEVLKLNVNNILMSMDNDQENEEIEMDE